MFRIALLFIAILINSVAACAAELPRGWGVGPNDLPVRDLKLKAGIIVGPGPASLLPFGVRDCPTGAGCPKRRVRRPYLVSGDLVAVTETIPGYVYVTYPTPKHLYEGWVPSDRVELPLKGISTSLSAWAGTWDGLASENQEIAVTISGGLVKVAGSAVSRDYSEADIKGIAVPLGNFLSLNDDSYDPCRVKMVVLNSALAVEDAPSCDGPNVTLSGIYRRDELWTLLPSTIKKSSSP